MSTARRELLQLGGDLLRARDPERAVAVQDHRAGVIGLDVGDRRRGHAGARAVDHEQLADPLCLAHEPQIISFRTTLK